jgi:NAD(P)-dependent dehydrogenase (short-subunit alcohol dehydrogenase family)
MALLDGKTVLVTGGGRGLGAAICATLARERARVIVADIDATLAQRSCEALEAHGTPAHPMALDVGDEEQVKACMQQIERQFQRLDAVVNNAGIDVTRAIDELDTHDWDRVVRTNLRGPFLAAKYAAPMMRRQGSGAIVNIVSTAAKRAWPNATAYHASKWGLLGLSHALHAELRPHGIKVSAVVAGGMRTPFLLDRFPDIDVSTLQDPEHVASAVKFLLTLPPETVIPEVMVLPMRETSWP